MACCPGLPGIQGRDSRTKPPPSRAHPRERLPWRVSSEMRRCPGPFPAFDPAIPTIFLNFRCLIFFLKPFRPLCLILCQYPVPQLPLHVAPDDVVPSARAQCTCVSVIWLSGSGDGIWFIESGYCLFFSPCMSLSLDYADIKDTKVLLKTLGIRTMIMITAHMY